MLVPDRSRRLDPLRVPATPVCSQAHAPAGYERHQCTGHARRRVTCRPDLLSTCRAPPCSADHAWQPLVGWDASLQGCATSSATLGRCCAVRVRWCGRARRYRRNPSSVFARSRQPRARHSWPLSHRYHPRAWRLFRRRQGRFQRAARSQADHPERTLHAHGVADWQ